MQEVIVKEMRDGAIDIVLSGEIDSSNADAFYAEVLGAYEATPANIRFDCEALSFIDSTTLGTFVKILKKVKESGFTLVLEKLQPKIKKLFLICALDSIMEIR